MIPRISLSISILIYSGLSCMSTGTWADWFTISSNSKLLYDMTIFMRAETISDVNWRVLFSYAESKLSVNLLQSCGFIKYCNNSYAYSGMN